MKISKFISIKLSAILIASSFTLSVNVFAAGNSFQVTPPPIPYPYFEQGRKDVKMVGNYVSMQGSGLDMTGIGFNGNTRNVSEKNSKIAFDGSFAIFTMGGDFKTGGFELDITNVAMTPQFDIEYQLYRKDKLSLIGFAGFTVPFFFASTEGGGSGVSIESTITGFMYGIPFGVQAGYHFHEKWTFAPFFMVNWMLGGSVSTSTTTETNGFSSFDDTTDSIDGYIAPSYGGDFIYEPLNISVGGALQIAKGGGSSGDIDTKTFHFSWHKRF